MDASFKQNSPSDDLLGATPGHEEPWIQCQDLFTLASSIGWSNLETGKLKDVYGIALRLDQDSGVITAPRTSNQ